MKVVWIALVAFAGFEFVDSGGDSYPSIPNFDALLADLHNQTRQMQQQISESNSEIVNVMANFQHSFDEFTNLMENLHQQAVEGSLSVKFQEVKQVLQGLQSRLLSLGRRKREISLCSTLLGELNIFDSQNQAYAKESEITSNEVKTLNNSYEDFSNFLAQNESSYTTSYPQVVVDSILASKNSLKAVVQSYQDRMTLFNSLTAKTRNIIINLQSTYDNACVLTTSTTEDTTNAPPDVITRPPLDLSQCSNRQDIFSYDQAYLKSFCLISQDFTYEQAIQVCQRTGMKFFTINNEDSQNALSSFAESVYNADGSANAFWVNGRKESDGNWYSFDPPEFTPLYDGINWVNGAHSVEGTCLELSNKTGNFQMNGFDCSVKHWIFCEYVTQPPPVASSAADKSLLNLSQCSRKQDLLSSNNEYLKSLCLISQDMTYVQADQICQSYGMQLFIIDSTDTQSALASFAGAIWSYASGAALWVNGRTDGHENFFSYPNRTQIFSGLDYVEAFIEDLDVKCLILTNGSGFFKTTGDDCKSLRYAFCEYISTPSPAE